MSVGCLVDTTRCIGCRACQVACKQWNQLPAETTDFFADQDGYQNPARLSYKTYTLITYTEVADPPQGVKWVFAKRQCMHCLEPACVSACPVSALHKDRKGVTVYDPDKCIGCRYCMMACPFGTPTFEWDKPIPHIQKCTFCSGRLTNKSTLEQINDEPLSPEAKVQYTDSWTIPACIKACPSGCLVFGERDELIREARQRIAASPHRYVDHIFGEKEAGGTGWIYLASVPFEKLGFPTNIGTRSYPSYTAPAMQAIAPVVIGVSTLLGGVYWICKRRIENEESEEKESAP